jgi:hypothetical protein
VRRQHRRDQGRFQQDFCIGSRPSRRLQPFQRSFRRISPRARRALILRTTLARAIFRDIGQQGEGCEPVCQSDRLIQRQFGQQRLQPGCILRARIAVIGDRSLPHRLDPVIEFPPALVADHLAQQTAQQADPVTQLVVGGLHHGLLSQRGRLEQPPYQGFSAWPWQTVTLKRSV